MSVTLYSRARAVSGSDRGGALWWGVAHPAMLLIVLALFLFGSLAAIPVGLAGPDGGGILVPEESREGSIPTLAPTINILESSVTAEVSLGNDTIVVHGNVSLPAPLDMEVVISTFFLEERDWPLSIEPETMSFTQDGPTSRTFLLTIDVAANSSANDVAVVVVNGSWTSGPISGFLVPDQVSVYVAQYYSFHAEAPPEPTVPLSTEGTATMAISVTNYGNGDDTMHMRLADGGPAGFLFDLDPSVSISPRSSGIMEVKVSPEADVPGGLTTTNIEVFSQGDPATVERFRLNMVVLEDRFVVSFGTRGILLLTGSDGFAKHSFGPLDAATPLDISVMVHCFIADVDNVHIKTINSEGIQVLMLGAPVNMTAGRSRTLDLSLSSDPGEERNLSERRILTIAASGTTGAFVDGAPLTVCSNPLVLVGVFNGAAQDKGGLYLPLTPILIGSTALAGALAGAVGLAAAASTEVGRYKLLALAFVPLYTKLHKNRILDHFDRGRIYEFVKLNPGCTLTDIKEELRLSNGKVTYHLITLEREELVKSRRDGRFRLFYLTGTKIKEPSSIQELLEDIAGIDRQIYDIIRSSPGTTQKDIVKELSGTMGLAPRTISSHIKALQRGGMIEMKREGRVSRCYPMAA